MRQKKATKLTARAKYNQSKKSGRFLSPRQKNILEDAFFGFLWKTDVLLIAIPKFVRKLFSRPQKSLSKLRQPRLKKLSTGLNLRTFGILLGCVFISFFFFGYWFWQNILKDLPAPQDLTERELRVSTKIFDRNGHLLYTIYKEQNRTPIPFDKIPIQVRAATIASEDVEFYSHSGFSVRGILRSVYKNFREGKLVGGSTITQQLVKNALLTPQKTFSRKIKEIILSIEVERNFSKNEILEMYLNEVPYGGTAYGIQEAAQTFFAKDAAHLTLAESALLASLPQSPSRFSPFGSNPEASIEKKDQILGKMFDAGFITKQQEVEAKNEVIKFAENRTVINAPHFVIYVRDLLEEKYGKAVVQEGGLSVITSLDLDLQLLTEEVVASELEKLKKLNVGNAAVIVMNPKTGEILAMVGSKDYFDTENDGQVNVALRPRQPGSSIKVINYAYALSNGLNPASIVPDTPTTFNIEGQDPYTPKNYDGQFRGNITVRSALAESRNIPAVKILASYGVEEMVDLGKKMGITTWNDPKNYGLSLTLGGGEVRLIDLAQVYATIADYGKRPDINPILSITDFNGKILQEFKCISSDDQIKAVIPAQASAAAVPTYLDQDIGCTGNKVLNPEIAFLITDILRDNNARSPAFGSNSLLNIKGHPEVAVKTGTSNNLRDNLAIGYTQDYLVAAWIGNNDNSEMSRIASGVTGATPIFNKVMSALLADKKSNPWPIPEGVVQLPICPFTGTLACQGCPLKMEWFWQKDKPELACSSSWFENKESQESPPQPVPTTTLNRQFEDQFRSKLDKIRKKIVPPPRN